MSKGWFADRSRYEKGHYCPFSRLLQYHLLGTGIVPSLPDSSQETGILIHSYLERLLALPPPVTKSAVSNLLASPVLKPTGNFVEIQAVETQAVIHGFARAVLPFVHSTYEIVSTEEEISLDLGDSLTWMACPDLVVRQRTPPHALGVIDFKSTRSKADRVANLHSSSLQSIMNSYSVAQKYGEPVTFFHVYMIQLGTDTYPTPLTHAYFRPANPPYVAEDFQPTSRRPDGTWLGKLYRRVPVHQFKPIADWVWTMPAPALVAQFPIQTSAFLVDLDVHGQRVLQALASVRSTESHWRRLISNIDWSTASLADLSALVPRTFACYTYDNNPCPYLSICNHPDQHFVLKDTTVDRSVHGGLLGGPPIGPLAGFKRRTPHHPQEEQ